MEIEQLNNSEPESRAARTTTQATGKNSAAAEREADPLATPEGRPRKPREKARASTPPADVLRLEILGFSILLLGLLLLLSLGSFRPTGENLVGPVGHFLGDSFFFLFGVGAFVLVFLAFAWGYALFTGSRVFERTGESIGYGVLLVMMTCLITFLMPEMRPFSHAPGGVIGSMMADLLKAAIGDVGGVIVTLGSLIVAGMLITERSAASVVLELRENLVSAFRASRHWLADRRNAQPATPRTTSKTSSIEARPSAQNSSASSTARQVAPARIDDAPRTASNGATSAGPAVAAVAGPSTDVVSMVARTMAEVDAERARGGLLKRLQRVFNGPSTPAKPSAPAVATSDVWTDAPVHRTEPRAEDPAWAAPARGAAELTPAGASEPNQPASRTRADGPIEAPEAARRASRAQPAITEPRPATVEPRRTAAQPAAPASARANAADGWPQAPGWSDPESDEDADDAFDAPTTNIPIEAAPAPKTTRESARLAAVTPSPRAESPAAPAAPEAAPVASTPARAMRPSTPAGAGPVIIEAEGLKLRKRGVELDRAQQQRLVLEGTDPEWEYPPLNFLHFEETRNVHVDTEKLRERAALLETVLANYKVYGRVTGICPGPVVTQFEFEPESGTKLSRISGLSDDISMALRATKVRIIAPIPGKGCVGIEVPNEIREPVFLKEILADDGFGKAKSKLTMALGKDIEGRPIVMDLAKSPHLLVAGTTGSGKSVSVNAMITSLLYNASPDEVKLILIDPKQLEFALYEGVPHLLLPVVTDPAKAAVALQWAVNEMERRYKLMAEMKVRNLQGYNEKLEKLHEEFAGVDLSDPSLIVSATGDMLRRMDPDGRPAHRAMYYLVVIVDEFADLMMTAGKEVETAVARLAQKARAAGIHVILATQRPSVDVITGLIKANFPTRISFRLMSGTDSRTVLDSNGAENLLGNGDMLYRPPGRSDLQRIHGAYIGEEEIEQVVKFISAQRKPSYDVSILETKTADDAPEEDELTDDLYDQAVAAVAEAGFASISMIQRKLRIGYNRSARMVERMERERIVGPAVGGSGRRDVLVGENAVPQVW